MLREIFLFRKVGLVREMAAVRVKPKIRVNPVGDGRDTRSRTDVGRARDSDPTEQISFIDRYLNIINPACESDSFYLAASLS